MRRREFITLMGGAAASWPLAANAQQPERMRRVGVVMAYAESDPNGKLQVAALREQLQKLGWIEGNNITIDFRFAADDPERIRALGRLETSQGSRISNLQWEVSGWRYCGRLHHKAKMLDCCCIPNRPTSDT
jgi:hypothetical protein